jgi:hypothetical protein
MSTRSLIGTADPATGAFRGRYVHGAGDPTYQGPCLTRLIAAVDGALDHVLDVLVRDHVRWLHLTPTPREEDRRGFSLVKGFGIGLRAADALPTEDLWITGTLGTPLSEHEDHNTEWGYVFTGRDPATAELVVFTSPDVVEVAHIPVSRLGTVTRMRGWGPIECGPDLRRCLHDHGED